MAEYQRVVLEFGKWAPDEPIFSQSGNLETAKGLIYHDATWNRVRQPFTAASVADRRTPSAALSWSDESGTNRAIGAVDQHLYAIDLGAGTITDRCKGGHYSAGNWDLVKFGPSVIATNNVDPVQLFNFSGASADLITSTTKPRGKYLCACRGHVILANISSPVSNPRQFRWSALNDAANWEPGSKRSGFGELAGDAGVITGSVGVEDFFLLFTTVGVYRASYIGGADVWSIQQVGGFYDGLPDGFHEGIIPVERDAYYPGRSGLKVIRNGEASRDIGVGSVRRFLMDNARNSGFVSGVEDTTLPYSVGKLWGCFDGFRQVIYWGWESLNAPSANLTFPIYAYSLSDDAFSLLASESWLLVGGTTADVGALFHRPGNLALAGSGFELGWGLCYLRSYFTAPSTNALEVRNFGGSVYQAGEMLTKIWRPAALKTQIHAIRPLWRKLGALPDPTIAVTVGTNVFTMSGSGQDSNGFIRAPKSPIIGSEFSFFVQIDDPNPSAPLRDFVGLELLVSSEKAARGGES